MMYTLTKIQFCVSHFQEFLLLESNLDILYYLYVCFHVQQFLIYVVYRLCVLLFTDLIMDSKLTFSKSCFVSDALEALCVIVSEKNVLLYHVSMSR